LLRRTTTQKAKTYNSRPKKMLTIVCNPLEFHLLEALPKDRSFKVEYYRDSFFRALLPLRRQVDGRKLIIHVNNARGHTARECRALFIENRLWLAVHPPYSPDLAPSAFFLFGHVKHRLEEMAFPSHEASFAPLYEMVAAVPTKPRKAFLTTGWRDSNEFLRTMVTPLHKLKMA
jgi:histone-lysine N-methyltransferase SETMAR